MVTNGIHGIAESWLNTVPRSVLDQLRPEGHMPTLGVLSPLVNDWGVDPGVANFDSGDHERNILAAEKAGIAAIWLRDIPSYDPNFGDLGQVHDVWTFAARLAAITEKIIIGTAAVVVRMDHPLHILRRAGSVDRMSQGRFVLGLGKGDRAEEATVFGVERSASDALSSLTELVPGVWRDGSTSPKLFPRPSQPAGVPLIAVGSMGKSLSWIKDHMQGLFVPSGPDLEGRIAQTRASWPDGFILCIHRIVLDKDPDAPMTQFSNGTRHCGRHALAQELVKLRAAGVDHVCLNLRVNSRHIEDVIQEISRI